MAGKIRNYDQGMDKYGKEREKKIFVATFLTALLLGLLAHAFGIINILKNHDNVVLQGYGTGITSGRWFLTWFGDLAGKYWGNFNL